MISIIWKSFLSHILVIRYNKVKDVGVLKLLRIKSFNMQKNSMRESCMHSMVSMWLKSAT